MIKLPGPFILLFLCMQIDPVHATERDWGLTVYGAAVTGDTITEVLSLSADYDNQNHFIALALAKKIATYNNRLDIEIETQWVRHFGAQRYSEYNALVIARWHDFPWDKTIDTSFAVGEGLSYASEIPEVEAQNHDGNAEKLLNYLLLELAFQVPGKTEWQFVTRLHHRSGIYGTFGSVYGASNAVGVGVRYKF